MKKKKDTPQDIYEKHLKFVTARLNSTNFNAEEKLKRIDDLADIIFTAKNNYKKSRKREDI